MMSRIARDSPGMERNVPRLGQVHSGTMKCPEMSGLSYFFNKLKVTNICILQYQQNMQPRAISILLFSLFCLEVMTCGVNVGLLFVSKL